MGTLLYRASAPHLAYIGRVYNIYMIVIHTYVPSHLDTNRYYIYIEIYTFCISNIWYQIFEYVKKYNSLIYIVSVSGVGG